GPDSPLEADLVVVDEVSMLDAILANQLAKAVAQGTHLLVVGDPDQLPSVGAGDVLADLLRAGQFPVTRLEHIFRQGAGSGIAANARLINGGEMPRFGGPIQDCYFLPAEAPAEAAQIVVDLVARRLPARYGFQRGEVQVLSPMHRGEAGVGVLNTLLQERLNPSREGVPELRGGGRIFRPGDRVLQLKNDYDLKVFNGDLGTVRAIDTMEQELVLALDDGREVRYPAASLFALTHAYAISVHKCVSRYERVHTVRRGLVLIEDVAIGEDVYTGEQEPRRVLDKIPAGRRRIVRVTTRLGYQIDVSAEHPILVADSALPRFVPAGQLTTQHYACLSRLPVDTGESIVLPGIEPRATGRSLELPQTLDDDLAWLLGVIVGDGSYRDTRDGAVEITNQDVEVLSECRRIFQSYGLRVGSYKAPGRHASRLYVVSRGFRHWLRRLGLDFVTAPDKSGPAMLFRAPARQRAAFLRGLFDTDGSASKGLTRSCRLVTCSRRLATEVQRLLLSLGIISYISSVTERAYHVGVSGTSLALFARTVGFSVGYKQARLRAMFERVLLPRTTNVDRIPFSRLIAQEIARALDHYWGKTKGIRGRGIYSQVGQKPGNHSRVAQLHAAVLRLDQQLSYRNLRELVDFVEGVGARTPEVVKQVLATNYFYDKIASVDILDESAEMYDIEIEGIHSFVANGFVCHNSQGAEFPAVVLPLLTSHAALLGRTLLYTAVTRARQLVVIVGQRKALGLAVRDWRREPRHTALAGLLTKRLQFAWPRPAAEGAATDRAAEGEPDFDPWEGLIGTAVAEGAS
ncbi:MAG: LAGLIDADG family homing endonuclease, partial [Chloroflexota bacterium]